MNEAIDAFVAAVADQDDERVRQVLERNPSIAEASLHVAAVLGDPAVARRLIAADPARVHEKRGAFAGDPLLYLCHSPFHGENAMRDAGLLETARVLLDAGADPNTKDAKYGVPALFAVTAQRTVLPIATLLLDAGANPTDEESMHHSAERFRPDAMELLLARGCDLNHVGRWGSTPLHFVLRWHPLDTDDRARRGVEWLLAHGADPNVRCGREHETSLHVAARRGQPPEVLALLIERGADVEAVRDDGATAWLLAMRGGFDEAASALEKAGAHRQPMADSDLLLRACARGDVAEAERLARPEHRATINAVDESGATELHYAALLGRTPQVRAFIAAGADLGIRDTEHSSTPLGWAQYGQEVHQNPSGDYPGTIAALSS